MKRALHNQNQYSRMKRIYNTIKTICVNDLSYLTRLKLLKRPHFKKVDFAFRIYPNPIGNCCICHKNQHQHQVDHGNRCEG